MKIKIRGENMKMLKFPSIEQYRTIVKNVRQQAAFLGLNDTGEPIYDPAPEYPTLTFKGTVKAHGTNASVCFHNGEMWAQSRERIITVESDNAGFAFFVESKKDVFKNYFKDLIASHNISDNKIIAVYGEWAGKSIQKGVALSELDKLFIIFGVKIHDPENDESVWIDIPEVEFPEHRIFNINTFGVYSIDIDFSRPELVQNKIVELTESVERECPIGKYFGVSGIGEGIVFTTNHPKYGNVRFKSKGKKHSVSKVKTLASVDIEKIEGIEKFVEYAVTQQRLEQGIESVFTQNNETIDIKKMGDYLRWVMNDIIKEEMDTLVENNLEPKEIGKHVSEKAKKFFMQKWNQL